MYTPFTHNSSCPSLKICLRFMYNFLLLINYTTENACLAAVPTTTFTGYSYSCPSSSTYGATCAPTCAIGYFGTPTGNALCSSEIPITVTLYIFATDCGSNAVVSLFLNNNLVGIHVMNTSCNCGALATIVYPITSVMGFNRVGPNTFRYSFSALQGWSRYAWAKLKIDYPFGISQTDCMFDYSGTNCVMTTNNCWYYNVPPQSWNKVVPSFASGSWVAPSVPPSGCSPCGAGTFFCNVNIRIRITLS